MRARRHHNNIGRRQIRGGKIASQVRNMARRLGIPYDSGVKKQATSSPDPNKTYWLTVRSINDAGAKITTDKLVYATSLTKAEERLVDFLVKHGHEDIIVKSNTME